MKTKIRKKTAGKEKIKAHGRENKIKIRETGTRRESVEKENKKLDRKKKRRKRNTSKT